jgi:hypothetical protein
LVAQPQPERRVQVGAVAGVRVGEDRDEVACAADQRFEFLAAGRRRVRLVGCSQVALGFRLFGLHLGCPLRDYGRVGAGFQRGSVAGEDLLAVGERASAALDLGGCGVVAVGGVSAATVASRFAGSNRRASQASRCGRTASSRT